MSDDVEITLEGDEALLRAFAEAPHTMASELLRALDDSASTLQRDWRSGARRSSGTHGKWYPSSITHDVVIENGAISADIGPDRSKLQGGMGAGFEYGSVNQPPHMDGATAFGNNVGRFEERVQKVIDDVTGRIG